MKLGYDIAQHEESSIAQIVKRPHSGQSVVSGDAQGNAVSGRPSSSSSAQPNSHSQHDNGGAQRVSSTSALAPIVRSSVGKVPGHVPKGGGSVHIASGVPADTAVEGNKGRFARLPKSPPVKVFGHAI